MKRRRKKLMVIIPVAVVCVAGAGTVGYFKVAHTKPAQNVTVQAQSAEAKKGNLSKTIVGTGNLELAEAEDQDAPSGLEISEVMVESGDEVKEGDVLAVVDESSILEAMEQVQEEISQLDESIQEYQDSDEENVIESSVSGRVKKINVSAGSDVSDTMVSDGALMVLSLDGKMAVSLSGVSGVSAGDSVTVTLSSGAQVTGTVDSVSGKDCVVTLTDNGTTYGDKVTVTDSSGQELGSGELTIHEPLEITGTSGTVSAVDVSENASVSEGTTLLTLEGSANETQYQELLAKREARTATLKKLIQLKADPEIKAEISGTVQSVNVSAGSSTTTDSSGSSSGSSSSGSSGSGKTVSQMSYVRSGNDTTAGNAVQLISLGSTTASEADTSVVRCSDTGEAVSSDNMTDISDSAVNDQETGETEEVISLQSDSEQEAEAVALSSSDTDFSSDADGEEDSSNEDTSETSTALQFAIATEGSSTSSTLVIAAPVTGQTPVTSVNASDGSYTGSVAWNPGDDSFQEKTVYQAVVSLTAGDGYVFRSDSISAIALGTVSGVSVSQDGKNMSFQITFPETAAQAEEIKKDDSGDGKDPDPADNGENTDDNKDHDADQSKDTDQITDGTNAASGNTSDQNSSGSDSSDGKSTADNGTDSTSENNGTDGAAAQSGNDSQTGNNTASGNSAGTSASVNSASGTSAGASQTSDTQETDSSTSGTELSASEYSTDVALFTISPDDTMTLEVSVDELDINSVEIGQEAVVTFDAIEDEEFTGEVTEIGNTASVNGGVAKYTVSVSVPKDEEMKQGMNASATITIENRENVITIPVNALQEKGDKVFVYTEKDEDGNLSGETEVTTGLSDGTTVEITEGLSEGDTVYYNKSGNTDSGSGNASGMPDGMGDFGDMSGGPGGNSDSGNSGGPGGNGGGPGGSGSSGGNGGGTPPNM